MSAENPPAKSPNADVFMSIKPEHIDNIAKGIKNHEYRRYLLPESVERIWFYTTAPVSAFEYVARISRGRERGQVPEDGGLGNDDFNAGRKESKFGYAIETLWRLQPTITLQRALSRGFVKAPPQKYSFAPEQVCQEWPLEKQEKVIDRTMGSGEAVSEEQGEGATQEQESATT